MCGRFPHSHGPLAPVADRGVEDVGKFETLSFSLSHSFGPIITHKGRTKVRQVGRIREVQEYI